MRKVIAGVLLLLSLLSLSSCAEQDPFDAGIPLTSDELQSLKDALPKDDASPAEPQPTPESSVDVSTGEGEGTQTVGTVYWLESGSVYHVIADCHYLKNKVNVKFGTVEDATAAAKSRACSSCAGK